MTWRGILQLLLGAVVWGGALVALIFGWWLPLLVLLGLSAALGVYVFGPILWDRHKQRSR